MKTEWYVITGAPSSGKTTLINFLEKLGYQAVHEVARVLIDEEIKKGKTLEDIRKNDVEFQGKILKIKLEIESKLPKNKIVFLDRGIPDNIAYLKAYGLDFKDVLKYCKEKTYRKIFLLERLPFEKDYARIENEEIAEKLHFLIKEAYANLGYEIVEIPAVKVEERLKIILANID